VSERAAALACTPPWMCARHAAAISGSETALSAGRVSIRGMLLTMADREGPPEGGDGVPPRARGERERHFDNDAFYAALDAQRRSRGITWKKVAEEANVSASTLTRIAQGRRPDVDSFAALAGWAGLRPESFLTIKPEASPRPLVEISALLRRDPNLSAEAVVAIEQLVNVTYERFRTPPDQ